MNINGRKGMKRVVVFKQDEEEEEEEEGVCE